MSADDRDELWEALAKARRRVAQLEAQLPARTRDVNPPTVALRDALAQAGIGLWEWDITRGEVRWSDGIEQLFGLKPGEFDGTYEGYLSLLSEEARALVTAGIERAFRGENGDVYHVEHPVHPRGSPPCWTIARGQVFRDPAGKPVALVGIVADISARKESQDRLAESEERFKAFASSSFEGIAFSIDGRILDANDNLCEILGYEQSELLGKHIGELVHPADLDFVRTQIEKKSSSAYRHRVVRKDGTTGYVEVRGREIVYKRAVTRMTSLRDVTEQVELAQEHQRLTKQLVAAQKMEAIGQLAGGIAHDFNNIMMVMLGNLAMAVSDLETGSCASDTIEGLKDAMTSGKRAVDLVSQLLSYSRKQPHHPKSVELQSQLKSLCDMLRPIIPENVQLTTELEKGVPPAFIDPGQLQQVLMNLAINGRDAMPEGGSLVLGAAPFDPEKSQLPTRPSLKGHFVHLWVRDEGSGIEPEVQQRIFEPFFTTKPPGKGTGLGLSTAYGIIRQAGGDIFVQSEKGKGATFSLLLPVADSSAKQPSVGPRPPKGSQESGVVLVCEDNAGVRRFIVRVLEAAGLSVLQAETAQAALELSEESNDLDLLIADMVLPDYSGADLAVQLSRSNPTLKVLLVSGYAEVLDAASPAFGHARLQKPFSGEDLLAKVRSLLRTSLTLLD